MWGFDYLVRDPGGGAVKGYYPLHELGRAALKRGNQLVSITVQSLPRSARYT